MIEETLCLLKPDLVRRYSSEDILEEIKKRCEHIKGFKLHSIKRLTLSPAQVRKFYAEHTEKPFFKDLVEFMISGPIVAFIMNGENIISEYRSILGATNPIDAEKGTLRNKYGLSLDENSFHASDSVKASESEIALYEEGLKG